MEHLLSAKCFQRREERLHISSKTEYPFYLGVGNINGMEGESSHYSRICDTRAMPAPSYLILKAVPHNDLSFQTRKLRLIGVIDFPRTTLGVNWQRLAVEPLYIWF